MITIQDLYNIVGNKIANEAQKALIRNNFPPPTAAAAGDGGEVFERVLSRKIKARTIYGSRYC